MGGPGVFPPLPTVVETRGGWRKNEDPAEANRRSVYIFVRRNLRYPLFETFDMPNTNETCARRNETVTPTQALELLNNDLVDEWSRALAARVLNDAGMSPEARVDRAYRMVYSRVPSADERQSALQFLDRQGRVAGAAETAFADLAHALLISNEFLHIE